MPTITRTETHLYRRQPDGSDKLLGRVLPGGTFVPEDDGGAFMWASLTQPPAIDDEDEDEATSDDPSWVNPRAPKVAEQLARVVARSTYLFVETVQTEIDPEQLGPDD